MKKYPNLEALCGKKRSGKDYLLQGLIDSSRGAVVTQRLSFSDGLRDIAHVIYPWLPSRIDDSLKDVPFLHPNNPRNLSPRDVWLHLGSETGLRYVQPDIFLQLFIKNCVYNVVTNPGVRYIITDVRTPQEYDWIKANQIKLTRISKDNREGIVEDKIEEFIDLMEVDYEFHNNVKGTEAFVEFYRNTTL